MTVDTTTEVAVDLDKSTDSSAAAVVSAPRKGGKAKVVVGVLLVLLLAGNVLLGLLYWKAQDARQQAEKWEDLRASAAQQATEYATMVGTYHFDKFDELLDQVTAISTEGFAQEYRSQADALRQAVVDGKGVSEGVVDYAAVQMIGEDEAQVLVFLDQNVVNLANPQGAVSYSRMVINLEMGEDGRWKLAKVDAV